MPLFPLTPEMRDAAAAARRTAGATRKDISERLKSGAIKVEYVLDRVDTNAAIGRMRLRTLLCSLPGIGEAKAEGIMAQLGVSKSKRLKGLGPNQKQALREMFP